MRRYLALFFFFFTSGSLFSQSIQQSVLATGTWYKIAVTQSGVYTIDYNDLINIGASPTSIAPSKIAIYGNGGKMLPQENSAFRYQDLQENAIIVDGEKDGFFDKEDKIVFYAESPHTWNYNSETEAFEHEYNLYSDTNYYFLTIDQTSAGKRMETKAQVEPGNIINTSTERFFHEVDAINVNKAGRMWFGEPFNNIFSQTFNLSLPQYNLGSKVKTTISAASITSIVNTSFSLYAADSLFGDITFDYAENFDYSPCGEVEQGSYTLTPGVINNNNLSLRLDFDNKGVTAPSPDYFYGGLLNFIEVNYERNLELASTKQLAFRSIETSKPGNHSFELTNPGLEPRVLDITNEHNASIINFSTTNNTLLFSVEGGAIKEYVFIDGANQLKPANIRAIKNQNLHGEGKSPRLLIVTHPTFIEAAEELAAFKRVNENMSVLSVTTEEIYNEFASGKADISAIRDFTRFLYNKKDLQDSLQYLLLLGDGSYDYKNRISKNTNFVPIYESRGSIGRNVNSFSSDDFYCFMEDSEGIWNENAEGNHTLDIGVGRLPARTAQQAKDMVNKIIAYKHSSSTNAWKSFITFIADDGDFNRYLTDAENFSLKVQSEHPEFNVRKIFQDYYTQIPVSSPLRGYERSPDMVEAIRQAINNNNLIVNYSGHGGKYFLEFERVLVLENTDKWQNNHFPLFITPTCDFATADTPEEFSLGKHLVTKANGGGIGIISGSRPAYASVNTQINSAIYDNIFQPEMRLGDVMRLAKNKPLPNNIKSFTHYNRHYIYLGDPTLKLAFPNNKINLTRYNNQSILSIDTLKALSSVSFEGEVTDVNGQRLDEFNGELALILFDKESTEQTKGAARAAEYPGKAVKYTQRKEFLYSGKTVVTNGKFSISFIVPLAAADSIGSAKISMYAVSNDEKTDAIGYLNNFSTGGVAPETSNDTEAPNIKVYLDSVGFKNGDKVLPNPTLLAQLFDESGINTSTRDKYNVIVSVLNSDSTIVMTNSYSQSAQDFREGLLKYEFKNLPNGSYTLQLSASDVYNNRATQTIDFIVLDTLLSFNNPTVLSYLNINAYPNPFQTEATISLTSDREEPLQVEVYAINGIKVRDLGTISMNKIIDLSWDGKDDAGNAVGKGMYVCKIAGTQSNSKPVKSILLIKQ